MSNFRNLNPFELHKKLINEYILQRPGDVQKVFQRDTTKDRNDFDVLYSNHRFLWDDNEDEVDTWEKRFAKRYYDKLFKEYCIADLSLYKENKIALRWRIEKEVVSGKGQFICGHKTCTAMNDLRSWEVNFAYLEHGEKKNALIKLRLCPDCSIKLNYHSKKREIKNLKKRARKERKKGKESGRSPPPSTSTQQPIDTDAIEALPIEQSVDDQTGSDGDQLPSENDLDNSGAKNNIEEKCWTKPKTVEDNTREEEFDDYLADLLL